MLSACHACIRSRSTLAALLFLAPSLCAQLTPAEPVPLETWWPLGEPSSGGRITGLAVSPLDSQRVLISGDMLGVGLSLDGGETWESTFGFVSWEVADFTWHPKDPNRVWVGTMGGPYMSQDGGRNWELKRGGMPAQNSFSYSVPIERVLFDPNNSEHLIAAGGSSRRWNIQQVDPAFGAVWESNDGGDNWSQLSTLTSQGSSQAPDADGINIVGMTFAAQSSALLYATVDDQGFYRSLDGGTNWQKSNMGLPHASVERVRAHPTNPLTVYISLSNDGLLPGGVYRSVDGGSNWSPMNSGLPQQSGPQPGNTSRYQAFDIDSQQGDFLVAGDDRFGSEGIYSSDTAGSSWSLALAESEIDLPYPSTIEMEVIEISDGDPNILFAGGSANVVRSLDGGLTWNDAANRRFRDGSFQGAGFSGLVATEFTINPWNTEHWIAQGFDGAKVLQTTNGGMSWTLEATDPSPFSGGADAVFASPTRVYASLGFQGSYQGVARSLDAGQSWEILGGAAIGLPELGSDNKAGSIHASVQDPQRVWVIVAGDLYRSFDGGDSWSLTLSGVGEGWLVASPDESRLYLSTPTGIRMSTDGIQFTAIGGPARPGKLAMARDGTLWIAAHDRTGNPGLGLWTYRSAQGWNAVLDPDALSGDWKQAVQYMVEPLGRPSTATFLFFVALRSDSTRRRDTGSSWEPPGGASISTCCLADFETNSR